MTEGELAFLHETALRMPHGARVVELGSWKGRSTVAICEGLKEKESEFWSVDTFQGGASVVGQSQGEDLLRQFKANTAMYPFVNIIVSDTTVASERFEAQTIDWLFIDASHSYAAIASDISKWYEKLRPGGLVSGHDYAMFGVAMAVNRAFAQFELCETIWHTRTRPRRRLPGKPEIILRKALGYAWYRLDLYFRGVAPR